MYASCQVIEKVREKIIFLSSQHLSGGSTLLGTVFLRHNYDFADSPFVRITVVPTPHLRSFYLK